MKRSKRTANSFRRYIRRYLKAMCRKRRNQKKHRSVRCQRAQVLFRMSFILIIASILFTNEKSQKITSEKSKSVQTSEHYLLENNPLEKNKYQPLNYLVVDYFTKLSSGNLDGICKLYESFSEESFEKIRPDRIWLNGIRELIFTQRRRKSHMPMLPLSAII